MNRLEARNKIFDAIDENFTIEDNTFSDDRFIETAISEEFSHRGFSEKLSDILNKIFPENKNPIVVNNCDSIDDILDNNFKF